jgi:hypothetical protein
VDGLRTRPVGLCQHCGEYFWSKEHQASLRYWHLYERLLQHRRKAFRKTVREQGLLAVRSVFSLLD